MTQLSDYAIKQAKPKDKEYFLKDGAGLFLRIKNTGTKSWVFRFYWGGKQEKLIVALPYRRTHHNLRARLGVVSLRLQIEADA